MSINYAILGILSWKAMTGYDLKKIIQESTFMYWSANNNQIYKALLELLEDGLVTYEVQHQETSPSKKVYTITGEGLAELKEWVLTTPEPPEFKKTFLIKLAWADQLNQEELNHLLAEYEQQVKLQFLAQKEIQRRGIFSPDRTKRETYLWNMIEEGVISSYEAELNWLQKLRKEIGTDRKEGLRNMNCAIQENNKRRFLEYGDPEFKINTEQDALELIAACGEHDTSLILLHAAALSDDFFKLKTGLAGHILQKFANYHIKTAILVADEMKIKGKFKELKAEGNRGNAFRVFTNLNEAIGWLTS